MKKFHDLWLYPLIVTIASIWGAVMINEIALGMLGLVIGGTFYASNKAGQK